MVRAGSRVAPQTEQEPARAATECTGSDLAAAYAAAARWLSRHAARVDSLNVFPVPDGDTGTNMRLTLEAAVRPIEAQPSQDVAGVARMAADAALLGARGNSGVILSQILGGFAIGLSGRTILDAEALAVAGEEAVRAAYRAVTKPVEGTMLTVIREAAAAARAAADDGQDLSAAFRAAVDAAARTVERTPDMLPLLREAGVVDAGGEGLRIVLDGIRRSLAGESVDEDVTLELARPAATAVAQSAHSLDEHGYCTNFVVRGEGLDVEGLRAAVLALGTSAVVAGSERLVKVHVHTEHPGTALEIGARHGELTAIEIANMREQVSQAHPPTTPSVAVDVAVVAVVPSAQIAALFASHGVATVPGGQTMNPSVEDLLSAMRRTGAANVLLLPNNGNVVLTARQAGQAFKGTADVIPTTTVPQGLAAAVAFLADQSPAEAAEAMRDAAATVATIEVALAARDSVLHGQRVEQGQAMALLDGALAAVAATAEEAAATATKQALTPSHSLITLYKGSGVEQERAESLLADLTALRSDLEGELVDGGQPHYPFIIALE